MASNVKQSFKKTKDAPKQSRKDNNMAGSEHKVPPTCEIGGRFIEYWERDRRSLNATSPFLLIAYEVRQQQLTVNRLLNGKALQSSNSVHDG